MKCACVCLVLWLLCTRLEGQDLYERSSATAGAWSHNFLSPEAALINPAAITGKQVLGLRIVTIRPYLIPGLSSSRISGMSSPRKNISIAGGISNTANDDFREQQYFLAAGRKLGENLGVGISIDVASRKVRGYKGLQDISALASIARNNNGLQTALSVFFQSGQSDESSFQPGIIAGMGKEWAPSFYSDLSVMVTAQRQVISSSLQYFAMSKLLISIRVISNPMRLDFESGWVYKKLRLSMLGGWHPHLGWSPGFALAYSPALKEEK